MKNLKLMFCLLFVAPATHANTCFSNWSEYSQAMPQLPQMLQSRNQNPISFGFGAPAGSGDAGILQIFRQNNTLALNGVFRVFGFKVERSGTIRRACYAAPHLTVELTNGSSHQITVSNGSLALSGKTLRPISNAQYVAAREAFDQARRSNQGLAQWNDSSHNR